MGVTKAHHHFVGEKMFKCWGKTEKKGSTSDSLPSIRKKRSNKLKVVKHLHVLEVQIYQKKIKCTLYIVLFSEIPEVISNH